MPPRVSMKAISPFSWKFSPVSLQTLMPNIMLIDLIHQQNFVVYVPRSKERVLNFGRYDRSLARFRSPISVRFLFRFESGQLNDRDSCSEHQIIFHFTRAVSSQHAGV